MIPNMPVINVHDAKTHLSRYLDDVGRGVEIVIARAGRPVARLVPVDAKPVRRLGLFKGRFQVPGDFDAPLPDEVIAHFEGKP